MWTGPFPEALNTSRKRNLIVAVRAPVIPVRIGTGEGTEKSGATEAP